MEETGFPITIRGRGFIQPHKTPDSRLEMLRQPGGLKQIYVCSSKIPPAPAGRDSLVGRRRRSQITDRLPALRIGYYMGIETSGGRR